MRAERWQPPETAVDEMLKLLGVPDNFSLRQHLCASLEAAKWTYTETTANRAPVPRKEYERVIKAARELSAAMSALDRRYSPRSYLWLASPDRAKDEIGRVQRVAETYATAIKRGQPRKQAEFFVVYIAMQVLPLHDEDTLSAKHLEFLEVFYETVTGETDARGKLEWTIRKARDALREPEALA